MVTYCAAVAYPLAWSHSGSRRFLAATFAANGLEKIIEVELTSAERVALGKSAKAVQETIAQVKL